MAKDQGKGPNWSNFKLRVNIQCNSQQLYDAWATPAGLESWFLREAAFKDAEGKKREKQAKLQKGDTYEWRWFGHSDEITEKGRILEANGKDKFIFTFSLNCPVAISIYTEEGESIVELVESGLPADANEAYRHHVGDSKGWVFYLANLKAVVEGNLDLRNKNVDLKNVITA